ncbi:MAG: hypothetical protein ACRENU_13805, partial [Gemmatimonadaceae bacterium]
MVFSRIFGKQPDAPASPPQDSEEEPQEAADSTEVPDVPDVPDDSASEDWAVRASRVIPRGASTGSKRVDALFGTPDGTPTHYIKAAGCHLVTTENETLVDCT